MYNTSSVGNYFIVLENLESTAIILFSAIKLYMKQLSVHDMSHQMYYLSR